MISNRFRTVIAVTIVNATVNTLLALLKIIIGYFGYSQALIADGLHSFSDLITDGLVFIAARMGAQSPDKEHPYGHRRIETIGAIIISLVLVGVAVGIAYDTIEHLVIGLHFKKPEWSVIVVAIVSVIANEGLFRYTYRQGNKIQSDLLRTNAWHNRSDALVSLVVLVSVIGTMLGVSYLDSIGALLIAALILKMGIKMIWGNIQELIDTAVDEKTLEQITDSIKATPGIVALHQLRTRSHGGNILVDVHVQVSPDISVSEGHYIGEQVHLMLINNYERIADVTVHIDPEDDENSMPSIDLPDRATISPQLTQCWKNLPGFNAIKRTLYHYLNGKLDVEVYLPLDILQQGVDKTSLTKQYQDSARDIKDIGKITLLFE